MAQINQFAVKDQGTSRDDMLRTIKNGLIQEGVANPNVGPGSDFYKTADALAGELTVIGANGVIKCDAQMPDSATDDTDPNGDQDLTRITTIVGVTSEGASGSIGPVIIECSAPSPIAQGTTLSDELGQTYEVTVGRTYNGGADDPVIIQAVSTGTSTNRIEGDTLTWTSAPPYCSENVTVGPGGLINGTDADDSEVVRSRFYAKVQTPPTSANWEQIAETAEKSTSSVQKGFVFPTVQGPSTCDAAVTAAPTTTNKSRQVAGTLMTGTVQPYVEGNLPKFGQLNTTTVEDVDTDVAIAVNIPDAPTANPPGPGGGWKDGTPWPRPDGVAAFKCAVTAVTSTTVFTVEGTAVGTPTPNVTRIAWLSPFDWQLYQATVLSFATGAGTIQVTIDRPFVGIAAGCFIWPDIVNAADFVTALLAAYARMGPGEKTSNASALGRGFRHPPPAIDWPYSLGPHLLRAMEDISESVASAQFMYRTDGTTTVTGTSGTVVPQVPVAIANAPRIFIPRHLAFYRIPS